MATHSIKTLTAATLTITNTPSLDILILPEATNSDTAGQVISSFGLSDAANLITDLESYALALKKDDVTISIGGNYNNQKQKVKLSLGAFSHESGSWDWCFAGNFRHNKDSMKYNSSTKSWDDFTNSYNVFHVTYNQNYESGAIKVTGSDARLILTAQNGAGNADVYSAAAGYNENSNKLMKTDDNIAIRSEVYGMYSCYNNDSSTLIYADPAAPTAPNSNTITYTIHSTNKLTVVSDLAGKISAAAAALHSGYKYRSGKDVVVGNDASNNKVIAAGIKSNDLVLDSNFRAEITAENNENYFNFGLKDATLGNMTSVPIDPGNGSGTGSTEPEIPEKYKIYYTQTVSKDSAAQADSSESATTGDKPKYVLLQAGSDYLNQTWSTWGTTIAATLSGACNASDNTIGTYGINTVNLSTADNTIWAGTIKVDTSDVRILADGDLLDANGKDSVSGYSVALNNNEIGAYGIYSTGDVKISAMGSLKSDDGIDNGRDDRTNQSATFDITANNNFIYGHAIPEKDKVQTVNITNTNIIASAIYANSLEIGTVTSDVKFNVTMNDNGMASSGATNSDVFTNSATMAYGIYAKTATFGDFNGKVSIVSKNNFDSTSIGFSIDSLIATGNLRGEINVLGNNKVVGIKAATITVDGVLDTTIKLSEQKELYAGKIGIAAGIIKADAYTGDITINDGYVKEYMGFEFALDTPGIGMNIASTMFTSVTNDAFDFTGTLKVACDTDVPDDEYESNGAARLNVGIASGGALNLRVSGTIDVKVGYAIQTDGYYSGTNFMVYDNKNADILEIASSATVKGLINLGDGELNTMIIGNGATVVGGIENTTAKLNMIFKLEEVKSNHCTVEVTNDSDFTLFSETLSMTVDLAYAEEGATYNLYKYSGIGKDVTKNWKNKQLSFKYQDCNGVVTLDANTLTGTGEIKDALGNVHATVTATFKNNTLSVTVNTLSDEKAPAEVVFDFDDETAVNYLGQTYDAENETVTLDWSNWTEEYILETYGLFEVSGFEIEYWLYDEKNQKRGNSIIAKVGASSTSCTIKGVANNTKFDWKIRVIGGDYVTKWSNVTTISNSENAEITTFVPGVNLGEDGFFRESSLTTAAIDASARPGVTGIESALAELSWSKIESANPVRQYIIEYVQNDQQLTKQDVPAGMTLEEYIAGNNGDSFFESTDRPVYRKVVSGTEVTLASLQHSTYVYWRIKAVDSVDNESDWIAGKTFRVWTNNDTANPIFTETNDPIGCEYSYDIPAVAGDLTAPVPLTVTLGWNRAIDSQSGVRAYLVELSFDGGKTYTRTITVAAEDLYRQSVNGKTYDYTLTLNDLNGPQLSYRIKAVDYFGKESKYISGSFVEDTDDPQFSGKAIVSFEADKSVPTAVKITPTISWQQANDGAGELGVRYYSVYIWKDGEEKGEPVYTIEHDATQKVYTFTGNRLEAASYHYEIIAYDWFGRTDTLTGTFGSADMNAPEGQFNSLLSPTIEATFKTRVEVQQVPQTDDNGNPKTDENGQILYDEIEVVVPDGIQDATVVLNWTDNFRDNEGAGILYKVIIQDSEFAPTVKYEFWTTAEEGKSMIFSNEIPGRPVGIFEQIQQKSGKVWWRVEAYDSNYNKAEKLSNTSSFEFAINGVELFLKPNEGPAAPKNISCISAMDEDNIVHTGDISVSWETDNTLLGIYKYTITLVGKDNKYEKDTCDLSEYLSTDLDLDLITVIPGETSNRFTINNLKEFFGISSIAEDEYKIIITAHDASGRTTATESDETFYHDITRPDRVDFNSVNIVSTKNNDNNTCTFTLTWDPVKNDISGIREYRVFKRSYDAKDDTPWILADTVTGTVFNDTNIAMESKGFQYKIVAVDKAGNVGYEWSEDLYKEIQPREDLYGKLENARIVSFDEANRLTVEETVGLGDPEDCFIFTTSENNTEALSLTAENLANIPLRGSSKSIKINIYEGNSKKVWKTYTVKEDSRVFSDLLLKANTSYTFEVVNTDKDSVSSYKLVFDKTVLGGNNDDDSYEKAAASADYTAALPDTAGTVKKLVSSEWVGFGDDVDIRLLELSNSGKYTFSLNGVAADVKLTVYELLENGKLKAVGTITAKSATGTASTKSLFLDDSRKYYLEVKAGNKNSYGTNYDISVRADEIYPAEEPASAPNNFANDSTPELSDATKDGWVTFEDATDYLKISLSDITEGAYTVKLDGTNGKEIKATLGYYDEKTKKFRSLISKTGAANTDELILSRFFSQAELDKLTQDGVTNLFIQVSANGKNANSGYDISFGRNDSLPGYNPKDDKLLTTAQQNKLNDADKPVYSNWDMSSMDNWVGLGDVADNWKLQLTNSGLYDINIGNVENPVKVTLYQAMKDGADITSYKALKSVSLSAAAGKDSGVLSGLLLDKNAEYYISISGTGAAKGNNSDYTLSSTVSAAADMTNTTKAYAMTEGVSDNLNNVFQITESGAWMFTADNGTDQTVKVAIYELMNDGKRRMVKTISVKAGAEGSTGYLYLPEAEQKGTGIYFMELTGSKKCNGTVSVDFKGYSFKDYVNNAENDNAVNGLKSNGTNWVGMGDAFDQYEITIDNDTMGVYSLNLNKINGNNLKVSIIDLDTGKVLKTFTPAKDSTYATFSYDFAKTGKYAVKVFSADNGKSKFSEYTLDYKYQGNTVTVKDNDYKDSEVPVVKMVANFASGNGWVGLNDKADFFRLEDVATDNYVLLLSSLENDAKITLYEITEFNEDSSVKSAKAIKTLTVKAANGYGTIGNLSLNSSSKGYFVAVQASGTNGTKDTAYEWSLNTMSELNAYTAGSLKKDYAKYYQFTAVDGATEIQLTALDGKSVTVNLWQIDASGKYKKVKTITTTGTINTGDLCLVKGATYVAEVTAPKAAAGETVEFEMTTGNWLYSDMPDPVDNVLTLGTATGVNAVWSYADTAAGADKEDMFTVTVKEDGSYTINLDGINGNAVKVSIGTMDGSKFKVIQSATGKAGADSLLLSRNLAAGDYVVKVESVGKNTASQYNLTMTHNNDRKNAAGENLFNNKDDSWKTLDSNAFNYWNIDDAGTTEVENVINDWVGFGDTVDVFKVSLKENGKVIFSGNGTTDEDLIAKNLTLSLVDGQGKAVSLVFDKTTGEYTSKNNLIAGTEYFLSVKNTKPSQMNISYSIAIS